MLAMFISLLFGGVMGAGLVGTSILNLVGGVSVIVFILFLRRLSIFIQRPDLARRATKVLVMLAILVIIGITFFVLALSSNGMPDRDAE